MLSGRIIEKTLGGLLLAGLAAGGVAASGQAPAVVCDKTFYSNSRGMTGCNSDDQCAANEFTFCDDDDICKTTPVLAYQRCDVNAGTEPRMCKRFSGGGVCSTGTFTCRETSASIEVWSGISGVRNTAAVVHCYH